MAILRIEPSIVDSTGNFTFNNVIATSNVSAAGYYWANGQPFASSSYSNVSVAAYLLGNITVGNISATQYYWANGVPLSSTLNSVISSINTLSANVGAYETWANASAYGNANVSTFLTSFYPITNDGALRIGTATGPDIYFDALNTIYIGHGGSNHTNVEFSAHPNFSSNATFSGNATITGGGNLTVNNLSNITVKSGGAIHLESGAVLYANTANFETVTTTGNTATGNISAAGFYWANGSPFSSSNYGNTNVEGYLVSYTGNLSAGNITTTGNIVGGGVRTTTGTTTPTNPTVGDIWYDTSTDTLLRYTDDGGSSAWIDINGQTFAIGYTYYFYGNIEVAAYLSSYYTYANANAAIQATGIDTINANLGAYQIWANANVSASAGQITSLWSNAASQQTQINTIDANLGTVTTNISSLQANAAFQANLIDILTGNAATQGSVLDVLVANAAVQAANLTSLLGNAAAQEASLTTLVSNTATQATAINSLNANIIATNAAIVTANTGMKSYVDSQIISASGYGNTQVAAYLTGNIVTGNVRATGYYWANGAPFVSGSGGSGSGVSSAVAAGYAMIFGGF